MRKFKRSVAHEIMRKRGITQVNKNRTGLGSFFSAHWRDYVK